MRTESRIGIDRRLDIDWLDAVAAQMVAGNDLATIRATLFEMLKPSLSGGTKRGLACHKTVGVLASAWVNVSPEIQGLRDRALKLLPSVAPEQRVAVHWAMLTAGFSYFADAAENIGRLIKLQGNFSLAQLARRIRETWGDRSTLKQATQRLVRSMVQWEILEDTTNRGVYAREAKPIVVRDELAELLLEGLLMHQGEGLPLSQAIQHPGLFPFKVELRTPSLRKSSRFEVHRQGFDVDFVRLVSWQEG